MANDRVWDVQPVLFRSPLPSDHSRLDHQHMSNGHFARFSEHQLSWLTKPCSAVFSLGSGSRGRIVDALLRHHIQLPPNDA